MASEDRGPIIVGVLALATFLSYAFVFARVVTRTFIRPQFGMDDALIVATVLIYTGYSTAYFVAVHHGFGRPLASLDLDQAQKALQASVVGEVCAVWSFPTGKAAVAYLLIRLFPGKTLRWVLWLFVAANAILFYLNGVFILAQCTPVSYQWNRMIPGGTCWSSAFVEDWGYVTGSVGAFTDFAFAIMPWFYVARLEMNIRMKLAIGAALSAGLFPFVCSILKIDYTSTLGTNVDPTYSTVNLVIAGNAECCAINIAACIPTLRPLYLWCRGKDPLPLHEKAPAFKADQNVHDMDPKRYRGHKIRTPTDILLYSVENKSEQTSHWQSHVDGSGDPGESPSQADPSIRTLSSSEVA